MSTSQYYLTTDLKLGQKVGMGNKNGQKAFVAQISQANHVPTTRTFLDIEIHATYN